MPVSVFLRLFAALFAAGVSTAGDEDEPAPGLVWVAPWLFPVVPWLSALEVFGPGVPPVPLIVAPLDSVFPAAPPAPVERVPLEPAALPALPPELPPELCATATEELRARIKAEAIVETFILVSPVVLGANRGDNLRSSGVPGDEAEAELGVVSGCRTSTPG